MSSKKRKRAENSQWMKNGTEQSRKRWQSTQGPNATGHRGGIQVSNEGMGRWLGVWCGCIKREERGREQIGDGGKQTGEEERADRMCD